jgi:heptosyltransferase-3
MKYNAKRILVITTRQIGDGLLTTPLIHSLRLAYPHAHIAVLTYASVAGIFAGNTDINEIITVSKHPSLKEYGQLLKRIFKRYDIALSTLTGDRPILYASLAGKKRFSIVEPSRRRDHWKRILLQGWTELDDTKTHTVIQNLRLADLLAIPRQYKVIPPSAPKASETLDQTLPFAWRAEPFAVMHLAPMWHYKRWTVKGWRDTAAHLIAQGLKVIITGGNGQEELDYIKQVFPELPLGMFNMAGKLKFAEVARLISASKLYIGPDTAVTHIAAATGTPTIALFGPTNPLKWAPWPVNFANGKTPFQKVGNQQVDNVTLLQGPGDCVPCHEEGCDRHKLSHSQCLDDLPSQWVIEAINRLL